MIQYQRWRCSFVVPSQSVLLDYEQQWRVEQITPKVYSQVGFHAEEEIVRTVWSYELIGGVVGVSDKFCFLSINFSYVTLCSFTF